MAPLVANNRRCEHIVFDTSTRRNRKCKKSFSFLINGCKCCYHHANKYYGRVIAKIQALVRGNICRSKTNKLKEMPLDIQQIVTGYMREEFENSRYNCQLSNFLVKKIYKVLSEVNGNGYYFNPHIIRNNISRDPEKLLQLLQIIKLCVKYKSILNYNKKYTTVNFYKVVVGFKESTLKYAVEQSVIIMMRDYWLHPLTLKILGRGFYHMDF